MITGTDFTSGKHQITQVVVIINPITRPLETLNVESEINSYGTRNGFTVQIIYTSADLSTKHLAEQAIAGGAELIIAAGGDGTIMDVANALVGTNIPLGIVPLGTGNLLAINLGLPSVLEEAISVAYNGSDRWIDLVRVNDGEHYFAIMGGIGFDARVMGETDRSSKQRYGRLAYVWTMVQNIQGELFEATVAIDDREKLTVQAKSILIANMGYIDFNVNAFPDAHPDDGMMQIGILKASTPGEFARLAASTLIAGKPETDPAFDIFPCRKLMIELSLPQPFEYDGDVVGDIGHLKAEIAPRSVRIRTKL